jgi:nucleoside-diphosphate-sugar epimerase
VNDLFREVGIRPIQSKVSFETAYRAGWLLEILYSLIRSRKEPQMTRFLSEQLAKSHYFSIENAKNDFGYTPVVSTQVGLEKTVEWLNNVK